MMQTTLVYIIAGDQLLLAMKKRSHGAGKWNGPGGKVRAGESVEEGACREVKEEVGVDVKPEDLQSVGEVEFVYEARPDTTNHCFVFLTRCFSGEPIESEEMRPQWFPLNDLPWEEMWESDKLWLSKALVGNVVRYRFGFDDQVCLKTAENLL